MSLFFETIKVQNSVIYNLKLHNERLNRTRKKFYHDTKEIDLKDFISPPKDNRLYRCKVVYDSCIKSVDFYPYEEREIKSFKIVYSDIEYDYKYHDRSKIDNLFAKKEACDDILIVDHHDRLRDTSIANIAIMIDGIWWTPKNPLLKGTMREKFLRDNILYEKELFVKDIENIENFAIMNAMIGFKILGDSSEKLFCK